MKYILETIRTKLEDGLGKQVEHYYLGKPEIVPKEVANRGFIYVRPGLDETELAQTQTDRGMYTVYLGVGRDHRKDQNKRADWFLPTKWLVEVIQNTDNNGNLQTNTIKYILRNNLVEVGKFHDMVIDYEADELLEKYSSGALITLNITTLRGI